jgi:CelD/BcsL family acetyltransferase involved in cellulose biosynthesis
LVSETRTVTADAGPEGVIRRGGVVERLDPAEVPHWDADLQACPGATFFHGAAWARTLKGAYGYAPSYFTVRDAGGIRALLPMMEVDSWLTGRRGVSLPFTDECGPLAADPENFKALHRQSLNYAAARRWKYLEFRGGRDLFGDAPASASFLGHRLDLHGGRDGLFARCDSSVRRAVRKAEQSGLTIEFSRDLGAVRDFHNLLLKTRKRHGVPPQPFEFFASIHRNILAEGQGWVVLARLGRTPVAGAVYFHFGNAVIYKYGASDEAFQHLRANNLVMWRSIERHAADGFESFDFGRTSLDNKGLRKFKLDWGSVEYRIDYVRYNRRAGGFAAPREEMPGWQTSLFRMMPDRLFQFIGSALYRHVA